MFVPFQAMNVTSPLHRLLARAARLSCRRIGSAGASAEDLARHWRNVFQDGGVPEAKESSEILIAHALGAKTVRTTRTGRSSASVRWFHIRLSIYFFIWLVAAEQPPPPLQPLPFTDWLQSYNVVVWSPRDPITPQRFVARISRRK